MLLMKYESIKLVTFITEESMEESKKNLVIIGDEEEERPAMKQENTELEVARARGGRRAI